MARSRASRLTILLAGTALLLTGCASPPPAGPPVPLPSPDVRLGPVVELWAFKTADDHIATLLDDQGNAHVFLAAANPREVDHAVVAPDGTVQRERVESGTAPSTLSAAFDSDARLHILLDDRHLVRERSSWAISHDTPWEAAGIRIRTPAFAHARKGLVWTFMVKGGEVGAQGRWDWYGFGGGFGAGIIFPWHSASQKLVIVPEPAMAKPLWYVLDPQDNLDASSATPAVDGNGSLHVVYAASRSGMAASDQPRYAHVALLSPPPRQDIRDDVIGRRELYPFSGNPIPFLDRERAGFPQAASAVDPTSGTLLVVKTDDTSLARAHGKWSLPSKLPLSRYWSPRLAAAGGDAFHLMAVADGRVLYLLYAHGNWSAPIELGQAAVVSGHIWDALGIASNGHNRAFVVWPTKTGIVGRWVEGAGEIHALAGAGRVDDAVRIPDALLDFAHGKAELITPGWTSGFAAATAAGSNGPLTKHLHDSGQWETLAAAVLNDKYGDDLRWYFLGRAAEGMALCDAAEAYYQISKERSEHFETRCLSIACLGFKLPDILEARFKAVEAMRTAGKCSAPSMQHAPQIP